MCTPTLRFLIVALLLVAAEAAAQTGRVRSAATLIGVVPNASHLVGTSAAVELAIRWIVVASPTGDPVVAGDFPSLNQFGLLSRRTVTDGFVRERAPQLSAGSLVIVVIDANGRELSWQQVADPRVIRAEMPNADLELSGRTLWRPVTELLVTIPNAAVAATIRVFDVEANGPDFTLHELGEISVGAR